jgi:hypothetical protein
MYKSIAVVLLALFSVFAARTSYAIAASLNLSTGLDASDALITVGNTPDAHWTVDQPLGGIAPARVVTPSDAGGGFPAWAANGPLSTWITIDASMVGNAPVIPYTYYRTFNVAPADVAQATISGTWGIDDSGDLRLNGNLISTLVSDYSATTPFSVAAGSGLFVAGLNTLTITMTFSDNFLEAVRLQGALSVPEPSSFILAALGIIGLAVFLAERRCRVTPVGLRRN